MKTLTLVAALFIIFSVGTVYADDDSGRPDRPRFELPKIVRQVASTSSTTRSIRSDLKGDNGLHLGIVMRVKGEVARYIKLLEAHITRLQNLITRLTTRANELDAKGISTTDGRMHLASSTAELGLAQSDLNALKADAAANASLNASTTPQILKERYSHARELMKSAREHIKKAYEHIKAAIKSLKGTAGKHGEDDGD
jgi:hypothetical protein